MSEEKITLELTPEEVRMLCLAWALAGGVVFRDMEITVTASLALDMEASKAEKEVKNGGAMPAIETLSEKFRKFAKDERFNIFRILNDRKPSNLDPKMN